MGRSASDEPIVVTGLGLLASVGRDRESCWRALCRGESGVRRLAGRPDVPEQLTIGAPVDLPPSESGELKVIQMCRLAAREAIEDAGIVGGRFGRIDRTRFGCAVSAVVGDTGFCYERVGKTGPVPRRIKPWYEQWLPNSACHAVALDHGLLGPRLAHSTACASGLVDALSAMRAIQDGQCDIALAGSGEGIIPLFVAGFAQMRVLADATDPSTACRPFDRGRRGFVMGEGASMLVVERLSHALARGARIYATLSGGVMVAEAHHLTAIDMRSDALGYAVGQVLKRSGLAAEEIQYVSAHGTGTQQNDVSETRGIRRGLGAAADRVCVSAVKPMLGHLLNAAGSVELAIALLSLRDGFVPPTLNLTDQDPECDLDGVPLVGRRGDFQTALKLSVAFGGHIAAVAAQRYNHVRASRQPRPIGQPLREAA